MLYRLLADIVVLVHFAFIVFVAVGGLLAWRWPGVLKLHVPSVIWSLSIVTIGFNCPLTPLEKLFRGLAGEEEYSGGFIDRYVEGVVYPESLTPVLRALVVVTVVVGYAGLTHRRRRPSRATSAPRDPAEPEVGPPPAGVPLERS